MEIYDFINMTPGQLFIKYWWFYIIMAFCCAIICTYFLNRDDADD